MIVKEAPVSHPSPVRRGRTALPAAALALLLAAAAVVPAAPAEAKYRSHADLSAALQSLVSGHKDIARLQSIGKTAGGRDIWAVEIAAPGKVPPGERPGVLVAANLEADQVVGSEIALAVVAGLVGGYPGDAAVKKTLEESVIYVLPRVNADGAEGAFAPLKTGRRTNLTPRDDDNDGRVDEDGPEDLNGDGLITAMRVKADGGDYMVDPEDARAMKKADPAKGERGEYKIFWEGIDNDGDGFYNEDPPGGVDINRNFLHQYPYYAADAGPSMASEAETRAVLEWMIGRRNIGAVLAFGWNDNLSTPPSSSGRPGGAARELDLARFADAAGTAAARAAGNLPAAGGFGRFGRGGGGEFSFEMMMAVGGGGQRPGGGPGAAGGPSEGQRFRMPDRKPSTTVAAADVEYFRAAGEKFVELTGIRQPLYVREPRGAFYEWAYYQFGVPAFSTPGFGLAQPEGGPPFMRGGRSGAPGGGPGQTGGAPPAGGQSQAGGGAAAGGQRADFMRMMMGGGAETGAGAEQAVPPGIDKQVLKWLDAEKIDGFVAWTKVKHPQLGEVEVSGFKPYVSLNPPAAKVADLGTAETKFVLYLASQLPRVRVAKTEVTGYGGGVFRVKAEVENAGRWPTALAQAVTARAVRPVMVQIGVKPEDILAGSAKTNFIPSLPGSGRRQAFEWIVRGSAGATVDVKVLSQNGGADTARIVLK